MVKRTEREKPQSFESIAIPFTQIGNRRGLTALQLMVNPWLMDFYNRFKHQFEFHPEADLVLFIEPEDAL